MAFLAWLEATSLAEYIRVSAFGYPAAITLHSIGLAVMVGPILMVDLRLLGRFNGIPYEALAPILSVAWVGFLINFLSGAALFAAQATSYPSNIPFLVKITLVLIGAITAAQQQTVFSGHASEWNTVGVPSSVRTMAVASIIFWVGAIVTGRLIAYL